MTQRYRLNQLVCGAYPKLIDDVPDLKPFYERVAGLQGNKSYKLK
jgi:hypothetical protein